jgi:uncharacterized membrane protein YbhN (UPF0104 family)
VPLTHRLARIALWVGGIALFILVLDLLGVPAGAASPPPPGGVGVTEAMNSAALSGSVGAATATAHSIGQQLIISAWDVVFARTPG